jgi:hypothetical protein
MYQPERSLYQDNETGIMKMTNQGMTYKYGNSMQKGDPKDLIKISPLRYIVLNNPQGAYDFLYEKGVNVKNNVLSTYSGAKAYASNGGDKAILEMVRSIDTPYKQMVLKAYEKEVGFAQDNNIKPKDELSVVEVKEVTDTKKDDFQVGTFKVTTQTIIIALVIVVFFLLVIRK